MSWCLFCRTDPCPHPPGGAPAASQPIKGEPVTIFKALRSPKISDALDLRLWNSALVEAFWQGADISALFSLRVEGASTVGGQYLAVPDPNGVQTDVVSSKAFLVVGVHPWLRINVTAVTGVAVGREDGLCVIVTPLMTPVAQPSSAVLYTPNRNPAWQWSGRQYLTQNLGTVTLAGGGSVELNPSSLLQISGVGWEYSGGDDPMLFLQAVTGSAVSGINGLELRYRYAYTLSPPWYTDFPAAADWSAGSNPFAANQTYRWLIKGALTAGRTAATGKGPTWAADLRVEVKNLDATNGITVTGRHAYLL